MTRPRFFLVAALVLFMALFPVFSIIVQAQSVAYQPGVKVGQFVQYEPLNVTWTSNDPSATEPDIFKNLNSTLFFSLDFTAVTGTNVTLQYTRVYVGGAVTYKGLVIDVNTGKVNDTNTPLTSNGDYLLLAGMLSPHDPIWNTDNAPTLNQTITEPVMGIVRSVNLLNYTKSSTSGEPSTISNAGFAWDQQSGALVEASYSLLTQGASGTSQGFYDIVLTDTDILSTPQPDFSITADPSSISTHQGSQGEATITLTSLNDFADNVTLTLVAPSTFITCTLSTESVTVNTTNAGSSTLSCDGLAGSYTVEVIGTNLAGGFIVNSVTITVNITDFSINATPTTLTLEAGSTGASTITLTSKNGFSDTVELSLASTPQGLTCVLSTTRISGSGAATLSCHGQPGSYTVTITATSGSSIRRSTQMVQVNPVSPSSPVQPTSVLTQPLFYAGIAGTIIVSLFALYLLQRRGRNEDSAPAL